MNTQNPLQQVSDVLGQAAQQLNTIAAPFMHGLPAQAPPPPPPSTSPSTGSIVLVGLGAIAIVGLGAWFLSSRELPHFGAVTLADLDEMERAALKHLQNPNFEFPDEPIWYEALDRLRAKNLMYVEADPNRYGYDMYVLTNLGQRVLSGVDPSAPVPETLRSQEPISSIQSKKRYSLSWEESA